MPGLNIIRKPPAAGLNFATLRLRPVFACASPRSSSGFGPEADGSDDAVFDDDGLGDDEIAIVKAQAGL